MNNLKVEGKVADFCPKCKNCKNGSFKFVCEDPYDGLTKELDANSDVCCSMFEPKTTSPSEKSCIEELIKASKRKDDLIQDYREKLKKENETGSKIVEENVKLENEMKRLKEANENLLEKCKVYIDEKAELKLKVDNLQSNVKFQKYLKDEAYKREDKLRKELNKVKAHDEALTKHFQNDEKLIDNIQKVIFPEEEGSDYTYGYEEILKKVKDMLNANKGLTDKIGSLKNKIVNQQSTHYKQCGRILELENMVSKLQSGEYDDILAKDTEIKSLQAKYEDAMAGWKDVIDTNDKLNQTISDLTESNEKLTKMVERRDRWLKELQSDVYTLQNECLTIAEMARKAYDNTNRD